MMEHMITALLMLNLLTSAVEARANDESASWRRYEVYDPDVQLVFPIIQLIQTQLPL